MQRISITCGRPRKIRRFYPLQAHKAILRASACIEMPAGLLASAVLASQTVPDPFSGSERSMGQCERHPAVAMLCEWWNAHAPVAETRCAGYAMVWKRIDGRFVCSYCETPSKPVQGFLPVSQCLARVGDDYVIEFWKSCSEFTYDGHPYDGWPGLQTWRVNGERGWVVGIEKEDVLSGKYDEAWYGLDGLRRIPSMD